MSHYFTHRPWHKCKVARLGSTWWGVCQDLSCPWWTHGRTWKQTVNESVKHYVIHEPVEPRPRWNLAWED